MEGTSRGSTSQWAPPSSFHLMPLQLTGAPTTLHGEPPWLYSLLASLPRPPLYLMQPYRMKLLLPSSDSFVSSSASSLTNGGTPQRRTGHTSAPTSKQHIDRSLPSICPTQWTAMNGWDLAMERIEAIQSYYCGTMTFLWPLLPSLSLDRMELW